MRTADLWLLTVLLWLGLSWLSVYLASGLTPVSRLASLRPRSPKPLTPRSENDCPHCRTIPVRSTRLRLADPPPPPWNQVKNLRGRRKFIRTEGYACLNPDCRYRLITDARIHALVGDGFHGHDRIPDFRCQACHHKFSARRDTALYRLHTPAQAIGITLTLLAEGVAPDALQRVFGIRETTQRLWLTRAGLHAQALHEHFSHGLQLAHVQLDELFTHARQAAHDLLLWVALDATTKFIPAFLLGPRTQDLAHHFIHQVRQTLVPAHLPVFSSDGLKLYFDALTAHFGLWVQDLGSAQTGLVCPARLALCPGPEGSSAPTPDPRQPADALRFTRGLHRPLTRPGLAGSHSDRVHRTGQSDSAPQSRPARPPLVEFSPTAG